MDDEYYQDYDDTNLSNISVTNYKEPSMFQMQQKSEPSVTPINSLPTQSQSNFLKSNYLSSNSGARWASQNSGTPEIVVTSYQKEFKPKLPQITGYQPLNVDIDPVSFHLYLCPHHFFLDFIFRRVFFLTDFVYFL